MDENEISYDPCSDDLARHFLQDEPSDADRVHRLAIAIQQAVEDWFAENPAKATVAGEGRGLTP